MISSRKDIEKTNKTISKTSVIVTSETRWLLSLAFSLSLLSLIYFHYFPAYKTMFGVIPREPAGLLGIITGPWIHGDFSHWLANFISFTIGFLILRFFYPSLSIRILIWGYLATGIWLWIVGRPSSHIGASGVVYMIISFLFFKGFSENDRRALILPLIILVLFSGFFYGIFPGEVHISWEGHLMGFMAGFFLAIYFRKEKSIHWPSTVVDNQLNTEEVDWEMDKDDDSGNHIHHTGSGISFQVDYKEKRS